MVLVEVLIVVAVLLVILYKWLVAKNNVLKERGVPHSKPLPLFGNLELKVIFERKSLLQSLIELHQKYKDCPVYGFYSLREPEIFIRDPKLIKKVGVKDFDNFTNHRTVFIATNNEILSKSLIMLKDRKWTEMRQILSPSFTGAKMRLMFELILECCSQGVNYIETELKASGNNELELEMKDYFTRFTNDVIASAAFGFQLNSFKDRDNDFFKIGGSITQFKGKDLLRFIFIGLLPKLAQKLGLKVMDQEKTNFFYRLVIEGMRTREKKKIIRPDMIQLLLEAKRKHAEDASKAEGQQYPLTDDDLLAQCLLFFVAGYDTVSSCLCFTAHELLANPEIQQRLYEEIVAKDEELKGKPLSYDDIMNMKYLDMVLSESLRKWPPAAMTDRCSATDYSLTDDDGNLVVELKKDDIVIFPIIGLHRDPANFPDPDKFDPERFSEENKDQIEPMTYVPFGVGPRSCIGNRLGLMETKAIIYYLLLKFKIVPAKKTSKDLMQSIKGFQTKPKELYWMKFVPRKG